MNNVKVLKLSELLKALTTSTGAVDAALACNAGKLQAAGYADDELCTIVTLMHCTVGDSFEDFMHRLGHLAKGHDNLAAAKLCHDVAVFLLDANRALQTVDQRAGTNLVETDEVREWEQCLAECKEILATVEAKHALQKQLQESNDGH